jgi:DNA-binding CsgD family transcriptional regulator
MSENDPPKPTVAATPVGGESYGVESWTASQWSSSSLPQQRTRLSGSDALLLLETIRECIAANTEKAFREKVYPNIQKLFHYDYATAALGGNDTPGGAVSLRRFFNVNLPCKVCNAYFENDCLTHDRVVSEHFKSYQPQYWSGPARTQLLPRSGEKRAIPSHNRPCSLLMDFGIRSGYTHGSAPLARGECGSILCFSSSEDRQFEPRVIEILEHLAPHMHLALARLASRNEGYSLDVALSGREHEVLNWLKEGKSSWDISVVLGVSERTVNFHVYNLLQKLDALNRPQAVAIAARRGLIQLD